MGSGEKPNTGMNLTIVGGKVRLTANKTEATGTEWEKTISGLPAQDEQGNTYYYWIEETPLTGYTVSYTGNDIKANTVASGTIPTITMTNTPSSSETPALPESGGGGTKLIYTIGAMLLMMSGAGYTMYKRRRWYDE